MASPLQAIELEEGAVSQQLPAARAWITDAIHQANAAGLSPETITATLFIEALGRQWAQHGGLALAMILNNLAGRFAATATPPPESMN